MAKFFSNCCSAYMHDYPDSDICPKCHNHSIGLKHCEFCDEKAVKEIKILSGEDIVHDDEYPGRMIMMGIFQKIQLCKNHLEDYEKKEG